MNPNSPTWIGRAILHVDMDAFFASVEQLDNPEWRGRPVIVGGSPDGRGVVSAASYEARVFGVRSAMPSARAAALCPNAIWARPHFDRYHEISQAVFAIFRDVTPHVQPVSVDEAFLDVSPTPSRPDDPIDVARDIQSRVDELGVSCSVGVATSKTVAKIASDFDKPHGITVVRPGTEASFLAPLPAGLMSGIGEKTRAQLKTFGIHTLGDLASLDEATVVEVLGAGGLMLRARSRGEDPRSVLPNDPRKSVSGERTFSQDLREPDDIARAMNGLVERVCRRLRRKGLAGRTVTVKIRFSDFSTRSAQRTVAEPVDRDDALSTIANQLVKTLWHPGVGIRLLGVGVSGFDDVSQQLDLFGDQVAVPDEDSARRESLMIRLDDLRERFGDDIVGFGSSGIKSAPREPSQPTDDPDRM